MQLGTAALLHSAVAVTWEPSPAHRYQWRPSVLVALVLTAPLASAAGFWVQTAAQRLIPPTRTAIILTMEPIFAGVFGYLLLGERLDGRGWAGAALILAGMLAAELGAVREPDYDEEPAGDEAGAGQSAALP